MAVDVKKIVMSNRELEMAVLKEAGGCAVEDTMNRSYDINTDVILMAEALAKKLAGILYLDIGLDPRKRRMTTPRNFAAEKAAVSMTDPSRKTKLREIESDEEDYLQQLSRFDANAWDAVIRGADRIMRRAFALSKLGLVVCNVDHLVPDAVAENEIRLGNEGGRVPLMGTIQLTELGRQFLGRGGRLRKKKGYSGDAIDEEVEIVK